MTAKPANNQRMSKEQNIPRLWLQQDLIRPRTVFENDEYKWEFGRRDHTVLKETMDKMKNHESDPAAIAREKEMIKEVNAYWESLNPKDS